MDAADDTYYTLKAEGRAIYREKASKFIAVALPVASEEEAKQALEKIRKACHDANHHCYAYRIGSRQPVYRANDDGEPSGSAGKPIYGQILSTGLTDVLVVVTRYFGGTKLGVPGLIHAYRTAARDALDAAGSIEKTRMTRMTVSFDYPAMNEVMRILRDEGAVIEAQDADEQCRISFSVRTGNAGKVSNRLESIRTASLKPG